MNKFKELAEEILSEDIQQESIIDRMGAKYNKLKTQIGNVTGNVGNVVNGRPIKTQNVVEKQVLDYIRKKYLEIDEDISILLKKDPEMVKKFKSYYDDEVRIKFKDIHNGLSEVLAPKGSNPKEDGEDNTSDVEEPEEDGEDNTSDVEEPEEDGEDNTSDVEEPEEDGEEKSINQSTGDGDLSGTKADRAMRTKDGMRVQNAWD